MTQKYERDELRGRFTKFMEITVRNARANYLRKLSRQLKTLYLEDLPEEQFAAYDTINFSYGESAFAFEEERLANAFKQLPLMRQRILILLFVDDLSPNEIAERMNCSIQHIYNQRSLALKKLRQILDREE